VLRLTALRQVYELRVVLEDLDDLQDRIERLLEVLGADDGHAGAHAECRACLTAKGCDHSTVAIGIGRISFAPHSVT
jgi:hypothetical protein